MRSCRNLVAAVLTIMLCGTGSTSRGAGGSPDELQHFLDELVDSSVAGVVLQVADDNHRWVGVAGVANVEEQIELHASDTFPVFSVTKTLTAAIALQLIDEGRLSMDDTLGELLSATQHADRVARIPHAADATVRQLLNYSSGFYDYGNSMSFLRATVGTNADFSRQWTIDDLLDFAADPQNAPTGTPGSSFSYTSTGYLFLGLVIEEITEEPLETVMADRIFEPLHTARSYLTNYDEWQAPDVTGYVLTNQEMLDMGLAGGFPVAEGNLANSTKGARSRLSAGRGENGVIANANSLMLVADALFGGTLFSPALLSEMVTPQDRSAAASPESVHNYGMGLHLFDYGDQDWAVMMGDGPGGEAAVGRELNSGFTFVLLTNTFGAGVTERTMEKVREMVQKPN